MEWSWVIILNLIYLDLQGYNWNDYYFITCLKKLVEHVIEIFSLITETLVFVFLGLALFVFDEKLDLIFVIAGTVSFN